jgi:hypothetical protein
MRLKPIESKKFTLPDSDVVFEIRPAPMQWVMDHFAKINETDTPMQRIDRLVELCTKCVVSIENLESPSGGPVTQFTTLLSHRESIDETQWMSILLQVSSECSEACFLALKNFHTLEALSGGTEAEPRRSSEGAPVDAQDPTTPNLIKGLELTFEKPEDATAPAKSLITNSIQS